jgi:hypothetical protein
MPHGYSKISTPNLIYTMFGSMERLEEGKKVSRKNHFPLFGCLSEEKERLV